MQRPSFEAVPAATHEINGRDVLSPCRTRRLAKRHQRARCLVNMLVVREVNASRRKDRHVGRKLRPATDPLVANR